MGIFVDNTVSLFFEKGTESILSKVREKEKNRELEIEIKEYTESFYKKHIERIPLGQEIDFQGLNDFIKDKFNDPIIFLFCTESFSKNGVLSYWNNLKNNLYQEACWAANAKTETTKRLIRYYIDNILDIVQYYFWNRLDNDYKYIVETSVKELESQLERCKEELIIKINSHTDYNDSFAEYIDNLKEFKNSKYGYLNIDSGFFGRTKDIQYLDKFLDDEKDFLFTVIVGPSGVGKTKLLHHYMMINKNNPEWKMVFLDGNLVESICNFTTFKYYKNLMVIIDDAGSVPDSLDKWFIRLSSQIRVKKIRVVLLERGTIIDDINNICVNQKQKEYEIEKVEILPHWYSKMNYSYDWSEFLYKNEFYKLEYLEKNYLFDIIDEISGSNKMEYNQKNSIYKNVLHMTRSKEKGNPLFTIFLTMAKLDNKSLSSTENKSLINKFVNTQLAHWKKTICQKDEQMYRCFCDLIKYATATNGWNFKKLDKPLDDASEYLLKVCEYEEDKKIEFFKEFIVKRNGELFLKPLEPDIIGEYYVLKWLCGIMNSDYFNEIKKLFWKYTDSFENFLSRCAMDFLWQKEYETLVLKKILVLDSVHSIFNKSILCTLIENQNDDNYRRDTLKILSSI